MRFCGYLSSSGTEQIKFFMVADRLMYLHGEFEDYSEYYEQLEHYLPTGLVEAEKKADTFGLSFAEKSIDVIACIILSEQGINGERFSFICHVLLGRTKLAPIEIYPCCRVSSSRDVRDR